MDLADIEQAAEKKQLCLGEIDSEKWPLFSTVFARVCFKTHVSLKYCSWQFSADILVSGTMALFSLMNLSQIPASPPPTILIRQQHMS